MTDLIVPATKVIQEPYNQVAKNMEQNDVLNKQAYNFVLPDTDCYSCLHVIHKLFIGHVCKLYIAFSEVIKN